MYQAQGNEYKYEIERGNGDLKEKKREYYEIKRREQLMQTEQEDQTRQADKFSKGKEQTDRDRDRDIEVI